MSARDRHSVPVAKVIGLRTPPELDPVWDQTGGCSHARPCAATYVSEEEGTCET